MDMLGLVVRLVFSLAIVLGLLLLIARFAGRRFQGRAGTPVQVLHRQPITRGSSVAVVIVGTRILVLGATDQQVTLLTELEPDEIELEAPALADDGGSLLSPQTWKQALAAATRASGASSTIPEKQPS
jgi:flagellar protein FliO/FliZ